MSKDSVKGTNSEMSKTKGNTFSVILFGDEWTEMWRRRQQLAAKLAKFDVVDKVVYVEQPLTPYALLKYLLGRGSYSARISWGRVFRYRSLIHQINDKVYLITPLTLLPQLNSKLIRDLDHPFRVYIQTRLIKRLIARLELDNIVLWIGMPHIPIELVHRFNQKLMWYDYTDDYRAEPHHPMFIRRLIARNQDYLLSHADVVSVVSRRSYLQKMELNKNNIHWIPNAVDTEIFGVPTAPECPEDIKAISPPRVGYIGEITAKLDLELLEYLAQSHSEWSVLLIGNVDLPSDIVSRLKAYPSLHFLGRKPYHSLPAYLQHIDVGIYLGKQEEIGNISLESIQKIFLYLAAGKPVVIFSPAGIEDVHQGLVQSAATREEFVADIEHALANDSTELKQRRIEYARANSWNARAEKIATIITQNLGAL